MAESKRFLDRPLLFEWERWSQRFSEHLHALHANLDLAGRERRVHGLLGTALHLAFDRNHPFRAQRMSVLVRLRCILGVEDRLDQPGAVANVREYEPAVIAAAVYPPGNAHDFADVPCPERPGPPVPVAVRARRLHRPRARSSALSEERATSSCSSWRMSRSATA